MSRVEVRPARLEDRADLIAANAENAAFHHPWVTPFRDDAGFDAWFERARSGAGASLVAREVATSAVAAVININNIVAGSFLCGALGYYAMAWASGRGLMTEAMEAAIGYAWSELGLHRLEANIQPGNVRSIRLVQRLGFQREGFSPKFIFIDGAWRDHERWALLAD